MYEECAVMCLGVAGQMDEQDDMQDILLQLRLAEVYLRAADHFRRHR